MGLDIDMFRFRKKKTEEEENNGSSNAYEFVVDGQREEILRKLGLDHHIEDKVNQYYSYSDYFGDKLDDLDFMSASWDPDDEKSCFQWRDLKHELIDLYNFVHDAYIEKKYDKSQVLREFKSKNYYGLLKKYSYTDDIYKDDSLLDLFYFLSDTTSITVKMQDIPIIDVKDRVITGESISYQRKGLNDRFYQEYTEEDYLVYTKDKLDYIRDNYAENPEEFDERFNQKFVEGEMFVCFDW